MKKTCSIAAEQRNKTSKTRRDKRKRKHYQSFIADITVYYPMALAKRFEQCALQNGRGMSEKSLIDDTILIIVDEEKTCR